MQRMCLARFSSRSAAACSSVTAKGGLRPLPQPPPHPPTSLPGAASASPAHARGAPKPLVASKSKARPGTPGSPHYAALGADAASLSRSRDAVKPGSSPFHSPPGSSAPPNPFSPLAPSAPRSGRWLPIARSLALRPLQPSLEADEEDALRASLDSAPLPVPAPPAPSGAAPGAPAPPSAQGAVPLRDPRAYQGAAAALVGEPEGGCRTHPASTRQEDGASVADGPPEAEEASWEGDGAAVPEGGVPEGTVEDGAAGERRRLPIGAFQHLPAVSPAREILATALRRARMVRPTKGIVNASKRERNRGAKQIDTLTKELASPLGAYVRGFPRPQRLHPYERAVLNLTLGEGGYEEALGSVDCLRKRILDVGKSCAALINKTTSRKEAEEQTEKAFAHLEQLFSKRSHVVDSLKEVAKMLRGLPVVRHDLPTLCLVGAPNVGKSSLVRAISTGKPEVCNYPFTTRGISMGHFFVATRRHQVTDTPGLLARPDEERNNIELLTISALEYLPTSVLFVHDLTEECGASLDDQYRLYSELKHRFGDRMWIDAISKADLLGAPEEDPLVPQPGGHEGWAEGGRGGAGEGWDREVVPFEVYRKWGPPGALRVSTETGQGLDELVRRVTTMLADAYSAEDDDLDQVERAEEGGEVVPEEGRVPAAQTWEAPAPAVKKKKKGHAQTKPQVEEQFYYPAFPSDQSV